MLVLANCFVIRVMTGLYSYKKAIRFVDHFPNAAPTLLFYPLHISKNIKK